jgi:hypothetical protein
MQNASIGCDGIDKATRGQIASPSYYSTPQLSWVLNNVLLHKKQSLGVFNIMRGRDHGIPSYNKYRELCGLNVAYGFEDFENIPPQVRKVLRDLYAHPDDVDLWVGGASEVPLKDAFIGHTFSCK